MHFSQSLSDFGQQKHYFLLRKSLLLTFFHQSKDAALRTQLKKKYTYYLTGTEVNYLTPVKPYQIFMLREHLLAH
jgi:hypothetical protein